MKNYKALIIASFAAIYVIWGTTYLAILIGLEDFPPFILASFRFAIAGILLLIYCLVKKLKRPDRATIIKNCILGLIVLVGGQGLVIWAEQYISSGNAAIIVSSMPVWFIVFDKTNRQFYLSNKNIIWGVVLGFIGIVLLFFDQIHYSLTSTSDQMTLFGLLAVLLSVLCWITGTLYHRSKIKSGTILSNLSWQLLVASLLGLMISLVFGEFSWFSLSDVSWKSWGALLYLSIAGSIVAFVAYTWLLTQRPATIVGTYAYVNPVIAVFLGWWIFAEPYSKSQIGAMIIIIFSAYIINNSGSRSK